MTTYQAQQGVFVGRPPCTCGAAFRLHAADGTCPTAYRPSDLAAAVADLRRLVGVAATSSDLFVARGNVQRLLGHRQGACAPLCEACDVLYATVEVTA